MEQGGTAKLNAVKARHKVGHNKCSLNGFGEFCVFLFTTTAFIAAIYRSGFGVNLLICAPDECLMDPSVSAL